MAPRVDADVNNHDEADSFEPLSELGQRMGIGPKAFRAILALYSDLLPVVEVGEERGLEGSCVQLLERIHKRTLEGHTEDEIRSELELTSGMDETSAAVDMQAVDSEWSEGEVLEILLDLRQQLQQMEEKRAEDRDKLMMMLLRTQKEMQQVRYELAKTRGRRRKGLWNRSGR